MCTTLCSNFCKYLAVRHIDRILKSLLRQNLPRGQCESRLIDLFRNNSLFLYGFEAYTFEQNTKLELKSGQGMGRHGECLSMRTKGVAEKKMLVFRRRWVAGGGWGGSGDEDAFAERGSRCALSPGCLTELLYNNRALTSNHRLWKLTFPFKLLQ